MAHQLQEKSLQTMLECIASSKVPPVPMDSAQQYIFPNTSLRLCLLLGPGPLLRNMTTYQVGIGAPENWKLGCIIHQSQGWN